MSRGQGIALKSSYGVCVCVCVCVCVSHHDFNKFKLHNLFF